MTKIAELKDKGAVVAWSPLIGEYADVIALGSKVRFCFNVVNLWVVWLWGLYDVYNSNLLLLQRFFIGGWSWMLV